jgi:ADP-ribose pyrophosphatase
MTGNKKPWKVLETEEILSAGFFKMKRDRLELPDGRIMPRYYSMEFSDWVNIVPITTDGRIVLINQYRPPVKGFCIEVPGGAMEPKTGESPEVAAVRELAEETGYVPREVVLLAKLDPNPALQTNKLWIYLALDCEKMSEQKLDPYEEIEVLVEPVDEVRKLLIDGKVTHALCLASLYSALAYLDK